ncbi:MAG: hypothetical protein RLZ64_833, partial [Pseudomonadota bacterium]
MSKNQTRKPLEIKISTVVAVAALIGDTDLDKLSSALAEVTGGTPDYFEDEFTVIDLGNLQAPPSPDSIASTVACNSPMRPITRPTRRGCRRRR